MERGFLLDKEMLALFSNLDESTVINMIDSLQNLNVQERVLTKTLFFQNFEKIRNVLVNGQNKQIIEKLFINLGYSRTEIDKKNKQDNLKIEEKQDLRIINSPNVTPNKVSVNDFVQHFRLRYHVLQTILQERELDNLTSIRKIPQSGGSFSVIVSILEKRVTQNKNLLLEVEDLTGKTRILVNKNRKELFDNAKDLMLDDIVAFKVSGNQEILFANELFFPESYLPEKKRQEKEEWVAFTSDLHLGSTMFLKDNLLRFINWLNGKEGDESQRKIAKKVKYLFITGDSIDGVGVFPDQEKFLNIKDIKNQYIMLAQILDSIRKDIKIILCPGQHDGVRVAEPQPLIGEGIAPDLYNIKNLTLVSNPSLIEIGEGFRVLMYHGASMHGFVDEIEDIRLNHKHNHPTRIVKEMLKRRHLAPSHGLVLYIPDQKKDHLLIEEVPDIIATGDLHRPEVSTYNNILLVASSCWQSQTPFEEKVGNIPDPCKVPLLNLKTREIKILDFSEEIKQKDKESNIKDEVYKNLKNNSKFKKSVITISGKPGAGKTTLGKMISEKLNLKQYSVGDLRGKMALERGMTIDEFNKLGEEEIFTDKDADDYQKKMGETENNFVIDGRLSYHFIPQSFKIFLDVNEEVGAKRIFNAQKIGEREDEKPVDSINEIQKLIFQRVESDIKRYKKYYNTDYLDKNNYDLFLDTSNLLPEQVLDEILIKFNIWKNE